MSEPVKAVYVHFTDKEFERLLKAKGEKSWHDFILSRLKKIAAQKRDWARRLTVVYKLNHDENHQPMDSTIQTLLREVIIELEEE